MAREALPITPAVLSWARQRSGYSLDDLKENFKDIEDWERGQSGPTYPQLERLSDKLKLPIAVFFFPEPPQMPPIRESFRTLPDTEFANLPPRVKLMLRRAKAMQINLAELNDGKSPSPRQITNEIRVSLDVDIVAIARAVREYLGITIEQQSAWANPEIALNEWRQTLIGVGVHVFKDAFKAPEYSGFCLYDPIFPIIYVNNSCAKTRQIFTLFHELGHLLFETSGIDTEGEEFVAHLQGNARQVEIACNRFAAEFLLPEDVLSEAIRTVPITREGAATIARKFGISREVVYRKFLDRGLISNGEYRDAVAMWRPQRGTEGSGGDYYNTQMAYLGANYITLVLNRYYQNRISETEASEYLNVAPKNFGTLEARFAARRS